MAYGDSKHMFRADCLALSLLSTEHVGRFQLSKALKFEHGGIMQNSLIDLQRLDGI